MGRSRSLAAQAAAAPAAAPAAQATVTLDGLYQRRAGLKTQLDQAVANVNAITGAQQLCDQLIAQLEQKPAAAK